MERERLQKQLRAVPTKPGVYQMKDTRGGVLYVGKAANLRNRLQSYFGRRAGLEPRIRQMVSRVEDFECTVTDSQSEALILENTLIKRFRPHYNARLKDDKSYPYIKIDLREEFPQVYFTRRVQRDGARYFGPFASAGSVRKTMDLLKRLFPYRSCTKTITGRDVRPCLEYYINRCVAPCVGLVNRQQYHEVINQVVLFLDGRTEQVARGLKRRMVLASEQMEFEQAARLRDQLRAIESVGEEQKVAAAGRANQDVIALGRVHDEGWVEVFKVRNSNLVARDHFIMEGIQDSEHGEVLAQFVKQFYDSAPFVPPLLLLQHELPDAVVISQWLSEKRGRPVRLQVPQRGEKRRLVAMAEENARQGLEQLKVKWLTNTDALEQAMEELGEQLNLPRSPRRMECYDISNVSGTNPVGSMVVFQDGEPKTGHYRRFRIKGVAGINDYAMMQEMLRRRFRRLGQVLSKERSSGAGTDASAEGNGHVAPKDEAWATVPDLVIIDGGKGHLSAALEVFLELGVDFIPLSSLAKENEELFVPHAPEPIVLPRRSAALFLVQRIRDEAHRFAITFHRQVRSKRAVESAMDLVPGIGPKRKRMLLRQFGSVRGVSEAELGELAAVPGMTMRLAQKVKEYI